MIDFEELYQLVEKSSHETAFNKEECQALFGVLNNLLNKSRIVEIGVEYGRSTTVIGYMAKIKKFDFVAIDAWVGEYSKEAKAHVEEYQIGELGLPIQLWSGTSIEASKKYKGEIDLIHIDGDHEEDAVYKDCEIWLPRVKKGGYACFDDYGHDSLPGVYKAVSRYVQKFPQWVLVGRYGNKLGIFKKL